MTIFSGVRCSVTSCPFNKGPRGLTCGWLTGPSKKCHHPIFREAWTLGHELEQAQELPVQPSSLTSRATAANVPVSRERARQLILELEA